MPQLTNLDDYDRCLEESSKYCFVRAEVIPRNNSKLWDTVMRFSKDKNHQFDHRHLHFGICIDWCEQDLGKLSDTDSLLAGVLDNNEKVNIYLNLFQQENGNRERYDRIINQCINMRLKMKYKLMAKTVVEYCEMNDQTKKEDIWSLIFLYSALILFLLIMLSSIYDFYKKSVMENDSTEDKNHYRMPLNNLADRVLVTFSLSRNWYRLIQEPNQKIGRDLRPLDCLKFISMLFVVYAHVNWVMYESGVINPQDVERLLYTVGGTVFVSGALITTTFFVISGLLLTINFTAACKNQMDNKGYVWLFTKFFFFRYIRLSIPYAFVILLSSVDFSSNNGPVWRHVNERELLACRKNWWTNLLYVNNIVNTDERCMLQTWYLAADYQAFTLTLLILIFSAKWAKIKSIIFTLAILSSAIMPAVYTYTNKSKPIFIPTPQTQRDSFVGDGSFRRFYTPFYMNFGCYLFGALTGLVYEKIANNKIDLGSNVAFKIFWWSLYPLGVFWLMTAHPFWQINYNIPIEWASIFAGLQRNVWAFGVSVVIVGFTLRVGEKYCEKNFDNFTGIFRQFVCLPIFRVLGRLTYGAFMLHLFVIRQTVGTIRQPIFFGFITSLSFSCLSIVLSYFCSLILALLVELPLSSLLKNLKISKKEST